MKRWKVTVVDVLIVALLAYLVHLTVPEILAVMLLWLTARMFGPWYAGRIERFLERHFLENSSAGSFARIATAYALACAFILIVDSFVKRPPPLYPYATYFRHAVCLAGIGFAGIGVFVWPRTEVARSGWIHRILRD